MIAKIINSIRLLRRYFRDGGCVNVNISYVNPNNRFEGRKIVITGGSSGIGLATAKMFIEEGAEVLICARNKEKLEAACINFNSSRIHYLAMDISDVKRINSKIEEAKLILGDIDTFVNCAGVSDFSGKDAMSENMYDYIVNINQKGLFFMCKAQGNFLISRKKQGHIVNITSKSGVNKLFDPYTVSKWGANAVTYGLARILAPYNIIVNGVAPGCVATNITAELQSHKDSDNQYRADHATKRFVLAEEVASLILFLSSDSANSIIGQIIGIDGGIYIN